jgi:uncharacterized protein
MIRPIAVRGAWLALCFALLSTSPASAQVEVPTLHAHVTDLTGTLTAEQTQALEARLAALEQRKGSQFLILMLPSTQPQTIEEFSLAVAEKNKIGRGDKIDDGLLLLVAKDDRKARIEVGYGLEGAIPDAIASRVIREYLAPHFRQNDYAGGLDEASAVLEKLIDGEPLPAPMADSPEGSKNPMGGLFIGFVIGMISRVFGGRLAVFRVLGAMALSAGIVWIVFAFPLAVAFGLAGALFGALSNGGGRYSSGSGGFGGWSGGGGGGGWSGGGGSFGGGGASGGW